MQKSDTLNALLFDWGIPAVFLVAGAVSQIPAHILYRLGYVVWL